MLALGIGITILIVYLSVVVIKEKKIPASISETFYLCGKWWFTIVMMIEAILLCISLIPVTPINYQFLAFVSSAALGFVGASPHFKDEYEKKVHYTSAFTFGIGSQLWLFLVMYDYKPCTDIYTLIALIWIGSVSYMLCNKRIATFIAEITCVALIVLGRIIIERL